MTKDLNLLSEVSAKFTEDTLKSIIAKKKHVDTKTIEILSWNVEKLSGSGDNFLSVVIRLFIVSKINGTLAETRVIVKSLPNNEFRRKLLRSSEYFHNEIIFYTEIATRFHTYLKSKGQSHLLRIPECLASHLDGDNDFIVLEDVTQSGYNSISRKNVLTYNECKSIIEAMAKLHSISFGYKSERKEDFDSMIELLNETFYRNDIFETSLKYFHDDLFKIAKDALAKEYPNSKGEKVFNSYEVRDLFQKTVELCARKHEVTSVISHGDTWAQNFMIRKVKPEQNEILILDFQIARCSSPVLDLVFFIYQCTDKKFRDKYYDQLLKDYYRELTKNMKNLGIDPNKHYSWEVFQKEIKEQSLYGLMFALVNIPLILIPQNNLFDLDSVETDVYDISDLETLPNLEKSEDRQRLADVILHAVEKGFI